MKLNKQQEAAANHLDGPCLVIAVPGSGKTRLLVERVGRLVERGIRPQNVVCVTFTNKAADEMKSRICERLKVPNPSCFIGTFHRLCVNLLRKFGDRIGYTEKYTILDSDDQKDMVRQIARQIGRPLEKTEVPVVVKGINDYRENMWGRDELDDAMQQNADFVHIADEYIERIHNSNMIDFSGLLSETIRLLDNHKDVLERVQEAFKYIQVDEVQDTNLAQFYLLNYFSGKWNNILMVGDISQSIYKFRGARYKNIQDFLSKHPNCVKIELSLNYRSTPQIIAAADKLIRKNTTHMAEKFETENPNGEEVRCLCLNNQFEEAEFVGRHVDKLIKDGGWKPKDIAVLYRMNSMSEPIERALASRNIAYQVIGGHSFYERKEVKDCLAMLRFICNPKDGIAFHRLASLCEGVGEVTIGKIEKIAMDDNMPLIEACHRFSDTVKLQKVRTVIEDLIKKIEVDTTGLNIRDSLDTVVKKFDYEAILTKEYGDEAADRIENVQQLINSAGQYGIENPKGTVESYLQTITLITANDKKGEGDRLTLMSIHASKGSEYPIVFMVGVEQSVLPHSRVLLEDPLEGVEEERRLCYVGMTRAEKHLLMSYCRFRRMTGSGSSVYNKPAKPSQFLVESGLVKDYVAASRF